MMTSSSSQPLVSVVMPAFNSAGTIGEAMRAVLMQSNVRVELLIGDDASTDATSHIVEAAADSRVVLVRNATNIGPGPTRDELIDRASGRWIAFVDADDVVQTHRLRELVRHAERHPDAIVFDDILRCHDTRQGLVPWRRLRGPGAFGAADQPVLVPFSTFVRQRRLLIKPLVPRERVIALGVRHSACRFGEDSNYFLTLAARGMPLVYVPEALYMYRITPGSAMANPERYRLMRASLAPLLREADLTATDRAALNSKLVSLDRTEIEAEFMRAARGLHAGRFLRILRRHPWVAPRWIDAVIGNLRYQLHRSIHSGRRR